MSGREQNRMKAADDLNRGLAIVTTAWLALDAAETADDQAAIHETLYETIQKLKSAEVLLGVYTAGEGK